jgi:hypothetical protein
VFEPCELGRIESDLRRVQTDNKLPPWEWLLLPDGRVLKSDAIDHHQAHDLIGSQDIAWVAGAIVELGISQQESLRLRRGVKAVVLDPVAVRFERSPASGDAQSYRRSAPWS